MQLQSSRLIMGSAVKPMVPPDAVASTVSELKPEAIMEVGESATAHLSLKHLVTMETVGAGP